MRGMDDRCVDLIYLDPPFNSNRNYEAPIGSEAAGASFKDAWTLEDTDEVWWGEIADKHPALYKVIDAIGETQGKNAKGYSIYMAIRLLEMHRILKDTGSIYLHCDPTMSHGLKLTMDAIFGGGGVTLEMRLFGGLVGSAGSRRKNAAGSGTMTLFSTTSCLTLPRSYSTKNICRIHQAMSAAMENHQKGRVFRSKILGIARLETGSTRSTSRALHKKQGTQQKSHFLCCSA